MPITPLNGPPCKIIGTIAFLLLLVALDSRGIAQADPKANPADPQAAAPADERPAVPAPKTPQNPFPQRIPAPELPQGLDWLNTAQPVKLADLKGKFVLLDFWTYCCINCLHILPELKRLEQAYPHDLVVIGVHSAKFATEQQTTNIAEAVLRYEIEHPVVNDRGQQIWNRYRVRSWPTLYLIDPEGNVVLGHSGEFQFEQLDRVLKEAIPFYRAQGALDNRHLKWDLLRDAQAPTPLRFPGKVLADKASQRLFIADTNHNRIVVTRLDGTLVHVIGQGEIGSADGDFAHAQFHHPQGMALAGNTLWVADTENHLLRQIDLEKGEVTTIAGTGVQGRDPWPERPGPASNGLPWSGPPREVPLNSPWAVIYHHDDLFIAMAGPHQIWKYDRSDGLIGPYAGNGREDIVDGPRLPSEPYGLGASSFAQPSGLATDGKWLYVADSEGSSIRAVPLNDTEHVSTIAGTAKLADGRLFTFGDRDGPADQALLQHALGIAYRDGVIYVADTYNNKIKRIDLAERRVATIAGDAQPGRTDNPPQFDEPAGLSVAADKLFVADTNNHLIRVIELRDGYPVQTLVIPQLTPPQRAP